jgi:hypothetical protein
VGVTLIDQKTNEVVFNINFWHWRAIVEAIRSLQVLPKERVDQLHELFVGDLTEGEARKIAVALNERLLPALHDDERLLLDGTRTTTPDDCVFYRDPAEQHKNYSTNRKALQTFSECCSSCNGFRVC